MFFAFQRKQNIPTSRKTLFQISKKQSIIIIILIHNTVEIQQDILKRTFIFHRVQIPIKTKLGHFNET